MAETTNEIINNMLWDMSPFNLTYGRTKRPILIHTSIINKFKNIWHKFSENDDWKAVEYTLQIGSKCYEMFLAVIPIDIYDCTNENALLLQSTIKNSQFSFPWEEEPTLFINVEWFNIMERFIRIHNLQAYILKIEEKPGITWNDGIIKVVTFSKSVDMKLDIIQEYKRHLYHSEGIHRPEYYYMTQAFEWLQPYQREHFKILIPDECYSVFPIIFNHLRTLNYINELNIFDLLSIRLALCDDRYPTPSHLLKFDIDFMIKRELATIVRNNHLDVDQYLISKNYEFRNLLIGYLVYEFQHLFETVKIERSDIFNGFDSFRIRSTIKLKDEREVLNIIKQKSNINFNIDGSSYDRMSLSLFLDLIECHNVNKITLDANYRWINDECNIDRYIRNINGIEVELTGTNLYNFIEEFISSLKRVTFRKTEYGGIDLHINGNLKDYTIFDNITVENIKLDHVKIDNHMLQDLHKCNLKSSIRVLNCNFESTSQNWSLLNQLGELITVGVREKEGTWQSLYEFILDEILKTNAKEFQFDHTRFEIISGDINIKLGNFKFTVDELKSKLEIRYQDTNEIIDLFEERFSLQPDEKSDYDFYQ